MSRKRSRKVSSLSKLIVKYQSKDPNWKIGTLKFELPYNWKHSSSCRDEYDNVWYPFEEVIMGSPEYEKKMEEVLKEEFEKLRKSGIVTRYRIVKNHKKTKYSCLYQNQGFVGRTITYDLSK